jgi:ribosomal protein S27AE
MRLGKVLSAAVLGLAAAAHAGVVLGASCGACGYTSDVRAGVGKGSYDHYAVYYARDWKAVVAVHFDLKAAAADKEGLDADADAAAYRAAYDKFMRGYSYPVIMEAGKLPSYAMVVTAPYRGKTPPRLELVESGMPRMGVAYPCPRCGKVQLIFARTGMWD